MPTFQPNTLYYGDNLTVLRDFPSECVDLVYLDPPFNSNRSYNVLFKEAKGTQSEAQIQAFEDTWHWGKADSTTHAAYNTFVSRGDDAARLLEAFVKALGHNDVTAYLTMMAPRLVELRRVLKPTGSIYLHCDPTAGHYLRVLMDAVFGAVNFRSEIVWRRSNAHNKLTRQFGPYTIRFCSTRKLKTPYSMQDCAHTTTSTSRNSLRRLMRRTHIESMKLPEQVLGRASPGQLGEASTSPQRAVIGRFLHASRGTWG